MTRRGTRKGVGGEGAGKGQHAEKHQLTNRDWSELTVQNIELGVGHGGPNGAGAHPLKVALIAFPTAHPDGCLCGAIYVVDLSVG